MDTNEYREKLNKLKQEFSLAEGRLAKEYAFTNSSVEVGDIVQDHIGHVQVEMIKYTKGGNRENELPQCAYAGQVLTKQLKPRKNGEQYRTVYQRNLK